MCSACAISRPRSSKSAVEQSRRSLMLAEKAERIRTAPISSATARRALPMTWSSMFTLSSSTSVGPSLAPTHPGGIQQVAPSSSSERRARRRRAARRRGSSQLGAAAHVRRAHRDELDLPLAVGVAVPLLVRAVEALRERSACSGTVSSNDWPAIAQIRLALARAARPPRRSGHTYERTRSRRSSLATSPSADSTPAASGTSTVAHLELVRELARVQRARAAERDEREVARVVAALDRDERAAPAASRRSRPRSPRPGRCRRAHAPRPRDRARARRQARSGSRPSSRFASVTVGRVPPRP